MDPLRRFLPLFPLELVAFPGESVQLHVFEPRYKQLIAECREGGINFGIPAFIEGRLADYGTEMTLEKVHREYEGGELDIEAIGVSAFRLEAFIRDVPDKLYSGGEVVPLGNDEITYNVTREELERLHRKLHELLHTGYMREDFDAPNISFQLGREVGLTLNQQLELLAITKEADRQLYLIRHMHQLIQRIESGSMQQQRHVRGNGHTSQLQ